jgi:hypothetical protein
VPSALKNALPPRVRRALRHLACLPDRLLGTALLQPDNARRLRELRDRHHGGRCFVIGSGPSVNRQDLRPLAAEVTFGFNAFYLAADRFGFLPTYYLVEDPLPAQDNAAQLQALRGTTKILPWDLRRILRPDAATVYVDFDRHYGNFPDPGFPRFSADASSVVYWGGTVAFMALQIACYMGFRDTYLLGIDLSYEVPSNLTSSVITSSGPDANHFHADYFGAGKRWHDPKVERMQHSFDVAREALEARGCRLFNAGAGGNLQRVPRVELAGLFAA